MRGLHRCELLLDLVPNVRRQVLIQGVFVGRNGVIFAAFALGQNRVVTALREGGLQVDPSTVKRAGDAAAFFGVLAEVDHVLLKVSGKFGTLEGVLREEGFQVGMTNVFRSIPKSVLTIFTDLDQVIEYIDGRCCFHGSLGLWVHPLREERGYKR